MLRHVGDTPSPVAGPFADTVGDMYKGRGRMVTHQAPVQAGTSVSHGKRGPAGVGYRMQQISDTVTRIVGRAYVGNVSTAGKLGAIQATKIFGQQNCLALIFDINPVLLNDRVAVIASTFEKYVYQGVKFTYVPQCPTSIGGSVGLVFDRDPLQISANTQNTQFLGQVMSYEHAVLTPSYVPACTSYSRDPKELKTWFIGGTDGTLTTRETSQGNLLVYVANGYAGAAYGATGNAFNGGYGYIIMDYVLDLVAPTLMPVRQQATQISRAPGQWLDLNGAQGGVTTSTSFTRDVTLFPKVSDAYGTLQPAFFTPDATWIAGINGGSVAYRPGAVGEIHLGGISSDGTALGVPTNLAALDAATYSFKGGQKLYFCVHFGANANDTASGLAVTFHLSLSSARAAAAISETTNDAVIATYPDMLALVPATGNTVTVSGWTRMIAPGSAVALAN